MAFEIPVKSRITDEKVARYVIDKIATESALERDLRLKTLNLSNSGMISSSDVGAFLALMVSAIGAKRAIEIGTFTGYTALKIASALPENSQLICCDINDEWASVGKPHWSQAHVNEKIDLRLAPAEETLKGLLQQGEKEKFDFIFIDADKTGYDSYYELGLQLLRPGGIIVLDNMLWDGAVADESAQDETTKALRNLNLKISRDSRVQCSLLTVGDGLMLVNKK